MKISKFIVLLSFDNVLGGAQRRYLSLFNEISLRKNDYILVLNSKLYDIALKSNKLPNDLRNIIILDSRKVQKHNTNIIHSQEFTVNYIKRNNIFNPLRKLRNEIIGFKKLIRYCYLLNRAFIVHKPDYVYGIWFGGMIAWPLKYLYKFKFVYSFMDSGFSSIYNGFKNPVRNERLPLKNADIIDFLSGELFYGVRQRMNLNEKTKISITPCSFKNYNNLFPVYPKENNIVFCSRMTPIKNPLLFLQSIKLFNKEYTKSNSFTFQFIGIGECFEQMVNYVENNKLTNVKLLGNVDNPERHLQRSKIFVSIQQNNNYPSQALLEAMACGNAIIASNVGETQKLVSFKEGLLVALDASEISAALIYLAENQIICNEFGENARKEVLEEHTIERYLDYFYSLEEL